MDPNATLEEMRRVADGFADGDFEAEGGDTLKVAKGERLAELVQALDDWMTKGGFAPKDWQKGR